MVEMTTSLICSLKFFALSLASNTCPTQSNFILDSEKRIVQNHSIYGQYNYSNSNLFSIDIGLRGSYFKELDAVRFEPRLLLQKSMGWFLINPIILLDFVQSL